MTDIDWDDPEARARLAEQLGPAAYNEAQRKHWADSIVATENGHAIRPVNTQFGRLFAVSDTGQAFATLEKAAAFARQLPPGDPTK